MDHEEIRQRGFKRRTPLADAVASFASLVDPIDRTRELSLEEADGQILAETITADQDVPHYDRAAMDGWAVRASDTFGASDRAPAQLSVDDEISENAAVRVHTGSEIPAGADAVVKIENAETRGDRVEIFQAVGRDHNVGAAGEDVSAGTTLYEPGTRIRPSDLGLLKATGRTSVKIRESPNVAVIPTGEELVQADPAPGEIIETNGLTVAQLVKRWGGNPSYRSIVTDETDALRTAMLEDTDHDLLVTTGGSSVGERDLLPEIVDSIGDVTVHGVAIKPGHPVALGMIDETPIVMLPGYPVACLVNAMQFVRPALAWLRGTNPLAPPSVSATLGRKVRSTPGNRTFARVSVEESDDGVVATPTRASGAGVLSSVTLADGWVVVPESTEGFEAGTAVSVEQWEWTE